MRSTVGPDPGTSGPSNHPAARQHPDAGTTGGAAAAGANGLIPLHQLPVGRQARVAELQAGGDLRRRWLDLGLIDGTLIETVRRSPLGDPIAYRVRGVVVAFRRQDAAQILVQPLAQGGPGAGPDVTDQSEPRG